jgi:hypothetical protein
LVVFGLAVAGIVAALFPGLRRPLLALLGASVVLTIRSIVVAYLYPPNDKGRGGRHASAFFGRRGTGRAREAPTQ